MDSKNKKKTSNNKYKYPVVWILNLLDRYFHNKANADEIKAVENWNPDKTPEIYSASQEQVNNARDRISQNIYNYLGIHPDDGKSRIFLNRKIFLTFRLYAAVAILFIVVLGIGYLAYTNNGTGLFNNSLTAENTPVIYESGTTEIKQVILSDGSVVHLNGNSRIKILSNEFNKNKREVWLEEGEAFFDVAKNAQKLFIIHSGKLETIVRGTSFNIQAYQRLEKNIVSVKSGVVEINSQNEKLGIYTMNKQLVYNTKNDQYKSRDINWEDAAAWMEQRLVLKNASLEELKIRVQQRYGTTIRVKDNSLEDVLFNASFRKESTLTDVLSIIRDLYSINYIIDEKNNSVILYN